MNRARAYAMYVKEFDDDIGEFSLTTFLWKEMAPLIHERIFGSSNKSVFDGEKISYMELLRVLHELEETRAMKSIERDASQKVGCNNSKYARRLKSKRREL